RFSRDWSSDVCSSDLAGRRCRAGPPAGPAAPGRRVRRPRAARWAGWAPGCRCRRPGTPRPAGAGAVGAVASWLPPGDDPAGVEHVADALVGSRRGEGDGEVAVGAVPRAVE